MRARSVTARRRRWPAQAPRYGTPIGPRNFNRAWDNRIRKAGVRMKMVGLRVGGKPVDEYAPDFWLVRRSADGDPVGYLTSPWWSPELETNIALGWETRCATWRVGWSLNSWQRCRTGMSVQVTACIGPVMPIHERWRAAFVNDRMPLTDRLAAGPVICAEGFLFELERRGYLTAGEFVPEVALEYPDALRALHLDYQRAGSDIVEAFTYNGHREKMRVIGKEDLLEPLNRAALQIARKVADASPANLMAGNISNSNIWDPADPQRQNEVREMFREMVGWAVEEGADLIIGETFYYAGEALAALEVAKSSGLPVVLTIAPMAQNEMADGVGIVETCQRLEQGGADVVGMNCFRGPQTMLPWLREIRAAVSCPVGALPIPYRTTDAEPTFFNLSDPRANVPSPHGRTFPTALDPLYANRYEIGAFAREAAQIGINYLGVCCGASPMLIREVAEAVGRTTEASRFSERMENHFMYGDNERLPDHIMALGDRA